MSNAATNVTFGGSVALPSVNTSAFEKLGQGTVTFSGPSVALASTGASSNLLVANGGLILNGSGNTAGVAALGSGSIIVGANLNAPGGNFTPSGTDTGAFLTLATGGSYTVTRISIGQGSAGTVSTVDTLNLTNGTSLTTTSSDALSSNISAPERQRRYRPLPRRATPS